LLLRPLRDLTLFLSLRWRFGALLETTYSSNSLLSLRVFNNPVKVLPGLFSIPELKGVLSCALSAHQLNALLAEFLQNPR
jgi:hypothetical protein